MEVLGYEPLPAVAAQGQVVMSVNGQINSGRAAVALRATSSEISEIVEGNPFGS